LLVAPAGKSLPFSVAGACPPFIEEFPSANLLIPEHLAVFIQIHAAPFGMQQGVCCATAVKRGAEM